MATKILSSITGMFSKVVLNSSSLPTEEELNVIRMFACGNTAMRQGSVRIADKYPNCDFIELEFIREIESPDFDSELCTMYRETIKKNCR